MSGTDQDPATLVAELQGLPDAAAVRRWRNDTLLAVRREFQDLASREPGERRRLGQALNLKKHAIEHLVTARLKQLDVDQENERQPIDFDPLLPVPPQRLGQAHPTIAVVREMNAFFTSQGFSVVDGPELETDVYNFAALNIPAYHPAREMQDTIYLAEPDVLLRTHTSSVESHVMDTYQLSFRIVAPGKAYRFEDVNPTNNYMFYQYEGLAIDRDIHMSHLHGLLSDFLRYLYGPHRKTRFRAKYYPQVEPGLGVDVVCEFCHGKGCAVCKGKGWIEILGAGMVHPHVLGFWGIDWRAWSGFAFGMGVDRLVMVLTGIPHIRELYGPRMSYIPEV